jgi:DNA invertase Pin-like site-specific DNA recombinase
MTREKAHEKVINLVEDEFYTKVEIAAKLKMSKPTIYSRIKNCNWRQREIDIIETL